MADAGLGSRLCANRETLSVDCTPPSLVCDYITADCPDVSDELNCPCECIIIILCAYIATVTWLATKHQYSWPIIYMCLCEHAHTHTQLQLRILSTKQ